MKIEEAQSIMLSANDKQRKMELDKYTELVKEYYEIAKTFIIDAADRGSSDTGICHSYDDPYDIKTNELYFGALKQVAKKLRDDGFNTHHYDNRATSTMGITIDWRIK